mgnify:CR=1 FL=1
MVGENINKIRESKQMGLNETARKAGISGSYLSNIEKGIKQNPSMESLEKIAKALNVPVEDFFKENAQNKTSISEIVSDDYIFETPQEAMQFILKQPAIIGFGGFDANKMSDQELIEFANELLNQLKLLGYKYKK